MRMRLGLKYLALLAIGMSQQVPSQIPAVPHEAVEGWLESQLATALSIPVKDTGFEKSIAHIEYASTEAGGRHVKFTELKLVTEVGFGGVLPGTYAKNWLSEITINSDSLRESFDDDRVGDGFANCLLVAINAYLKKPDRTAEESKWASRCALLVAAQTDFLITSSCLYYLTNPDFMKKASFSDEQVAALALVSKEAEIRDKARNACETRLFYLFQDCQKQKRHLTAVEEKEVIALIQEVRRVGAVSQYAWWAIAQVAHELLPPREPGSQQDPNSLRSYLSDWHRDLPPCNAKRWIGQALTGGAEMGRFEVLKIDPGNVRVTK